ncbi:hypothetical protein [Aliiroseovarius sp. 2305UL8-7]|uniref:hypothetical protein n=1 Tax=Aliiroseovarius conchicola TaxID=3121637 RepID=UPI003527E2FD
MRGLLSLACFTVTLAPTGTANAESAECARFPDYCRAKAILAGQPELDIMLGFRRANQFYVLQSIVDSEELDRLISSHDEEWKRVNSRLRTSKEQVDAIIDKANKGGRIDNVVKFLKFVAAAASIADQVNKYFQEETPKAMGLSSDNKAVDGSTTPFGKLNAGLELSEASEARVQMLVAANSASRYQAVRAILDRLDEIGVPSEDNEYAFATEQEILLTKAYAIISGWDASEADQVFENFNFENTDLADALLDPKKINPVGFFLDLTFTSQPVGDGTIFSRNAIPPLMKELDAHSETIFRWRAPEYFEDDGVTVPWRLE